MQRLLQYLPNWGSGLPPVEMPDPANRTQDELLTFQPLQSTLLTPDSVAIPNMMGDLLRAYRGVTFQYLLSGDAALANSSGAITFRNTKVAENNSAIPRNRFSFRYNYFHNAIEIKGLEAAGQRILTTTIARIPGQVGPNFDDPTTFRDGNQISSHATGGAARNLTQTLVRAGSRDYDAHFYTMAMERTFWDDLASIEIRLPFASTLDSDLNLQAGSVDNETLFVNATPGQTLGSRDFEVQDMQLILKGILYQNCRTTISGGLGLTAPTGPGVDLRVVDYSNDEGGPRDRLFPANSGFVFPNNAIDRRVREFEVENETWSLSPFIAMATSRNRTYMNAFAQLDLPLNESTWRYTSTDVDLTVASALFVPTANPPFIAAQPNGAIQNAERFSGKLRDQTLMQLDIGGGYWLYQNPCARAVTGLAAFLELHYTTTLNEADIVTVPAERLRANQGDPREAAPQIGNTGNRIDILNATIGTHIQFGDRASLAIGGVFPLRDEFDRTFDAELNVQFNLYR